jgi:hypothetical protein
MAGTTGLEPATSAVTGQRSNQLSYVPRLFLRLTLSLRICCLSLLSIFSPASTLSTESNRIPRVMDSMKPCHQCRCRRPATQNMCPCPVIQIVPNKSGVEVINLVAAIHPPNKSDKKMSRECPNSFVEGCLHESVILASDSALLTG